MLTVTLVAVVAVAAGGYWLFNRPAMQRASDTAGLYRVVNVDSKSGFVDRTGNMVIAPKFDEAGAFSDGLARVRIGDKHGYIDTKGAVVINPQFDTAGDFVDGLAPVAINGRWGYVDRRGAYVVNLQFDRAYEFSGGLAAVITGGKSGYVSRKGQLVINPQFDVATKFSEGLAAVSVGQRWGYVDTSGQMAINSQFDDPGVFSNGLAAVSLQGRFGYIGTDGTFVINPQFEGAREFSEGAAAVKVGEKWGYIAKDGKYLVSPQFDDAWPFADGRGLVRLGENHGYIDSTGKYVINPQYEAASSFIQGLAAVREKGGRVGLIDRTGKYAFVTSGVIEKTLADMRTIASAWEARATDTNSYQIDGILEGDVTADQLQAALAPTYINKQVPQRDGWERPFVLRVLKGGGSYSILSTGSNKTSPGVAAPDTDDLVFGDGSLTAPISGTPVIAGAPFLPELVISNLEGEWRDDREICLRITRPRVGHSYVEASVESCRGRSWVSWTSFRLNGRSLESVWDQKSRLAFSWDGTLEGTIEGMLEHSPISGRPARGNRRFKKLE